MNRLSIVVKKFIKKNDATILTVIGSVGVIGTVLMTAKATPKALELIDLAEKEKEEELSKWEKVRIAIPVYVPTMLLGTMTVACIFGANVLNKRSQASLISAYVLLDKTHREYKNKLKELYGEEAHNNIINAIAIEKAEDVHITASNFCSNCDLAIDYNDSSPILFYDNFSKRYFEKTIEQVILAEYHLNRNYILRGYASVNELYDFLGMSNIECGDDLLWMPMDEGMYWIDFNHRKLILEDGSECYVLEMMFEPMLESEYD